MTITLQNSLPGADYHSPEVFELERQRVFFRNWIYVGRSERWEKVGSWRTVDIAGESILLVRGRDDRIRGFYNVCRHRGAQLCAEESGFSRVTIVCPYHAWTYGLDGSLVATPNVDRAEVDYPSTGLLTAHVETWQGFVFVNLAKEPEFSLMQSLADEYTDTLRFDKLGLEQLKVGYMSSWDVQANWKVLVENYNECLHCPHVHPELVKVIPTYRNGSVFDDTRKDGGVELSGRRTMVTADPNVQLPKLSGFRGQGGPSSYYGSQVYPLMFLDIDASSVVATAIFPNGPASCHLVCEYLFPQETFELPGVDFPSLCALNETVIRQDNEICERVQRGVSSRAFDHGVLPSKDFDVHAFEVRYLRDRNQSTPAHR